MTRQEFRRVCEQAEGYIALRLFDEAWEVIEGLPEQLRFDTAVLALQVELLSVSGQYLKASFIAQTLAQVYPADVERRLLVGRLLLKAGELGGARDYTVAALHEFEDGRLFYLQAQCEAALGVLGEAKENLQRACQLMPSLRLKALDDPSFTWLFQIEADDRNKGG